MTPSERVQNLWHLKGGWLQNFAAVEAWLRGHAATDSGLSITRGHESSNSGTWPFETIGEQRTLKVTSPVGVATLTWSLERCEGAMSTDAKLCVSFPLGASALAELLLACFADVGVEVQGEPTVY